MVITCIVHWSSSPLYDRWKAYKFMERDYHAASLLSLGISKSITLDIKGASFDVKAYPASVKKGNYKSLLIYYIKRILYKLNIWIYI